MVRTTSTNFISGTGLKKCNPINRSGRLVEVKSSVMEMDEVFDAKIASFLIMGSSDAYIFFLSSTFSMMASITMSQSARSCLLVVPLRRARIASFCWAVMPPFSGGRSANLASDFSIPAKPLSRNFCSTSSTVTSNPAVALTCAMPEPIKPQPRTPTFLISINTFRGHETRGLPRIMDNNLHWNSPRRDFANQIHKITSHSFRACADQVKIDNDQPIGNLHLINLTIRDAVIQGVEISPVPRWRADDAKERVIDVVIAVPCRSIH